MGAFMEPVISRASIESRIYLIRGQKVMLDSDLAELYGVSTRIFVKAVKGNTNRFPPDFMFKLENHEVINLRSQIVISSLGRGGRRYHPYAFTEQGVAMLSSVLNSERAVKINIEIMRVFVRLRRILATHVELSAKLEEMEKKYDKQFKVVFEAIKKLMEPQEKAFKPIGFRGKN